MNAAAGRRRIQPWLKFPVARHTSRGFRPLGRIEVAVAKRSGEIPPPANSRKSQRLGGGWKVAFVAPTAKALPCPTASHMSCIRPTQGILCASMSEEDGRRGVARKDQRGSNAR